MHAIAFWKTVKKRSHQWSQPFDQRKMACTNGFKPMQKSVSHPHVFKIANCDLKDAHLEVAICDIKVTGCGQILTAGHLAFLAAKQEAEINRPSLEQQLPKKSSSEHH